MEMAAQPREDARERRVLLFALANVDADRTRAILEQADIRAIACRDRDQLRDELDAGCGALLLPEAFLDAQDARDGLSQWLERQPEWSDLPILILARPHEDSEPILRAVERLGNANVSVLERPIRAAPLVCAARAALRARERQYQVRRHIAERARSERELRDLFDHAAIGIHWVGPDGTILRVNQTELDMLGYKRDEYVGRHIAEFHADEAAIADILRRLTSGEALRDREARMRCKDGAIKDILISSNAFRENGVLIHTRCFTRDVTDRKAAEADQARLAAIVSTSDEAIISMGLTGAVLTWNAGAERLFGYTSDEMIGRPILELIPPDRLEEERLVQDRLQRGERVERYESVRLDKTGRRLEISVTVSPIRNAAGMVIAASRVTHDIRERKKAEAALQDSEARLRMIADNIATLTWTADRLGWANWFNRRWYEYTGTNFETMKDRGWEIVLHPEHLQRVKRGLLRCLERGEPWEDTFPLRGRDGTYRWFLSRAVPIRDETGEIIRWFGTNTDVHDRIEIEYALLEADRRKDEFLATLAHELRNPLAPIRNSVQILRLSSHADPAVKHVYEMMDRQVNHMVRLVDDLLEISRITLGKIELRKDVIELADVIRNAVDSCLPLITERRHVLTVDVPTGSTRIAGDAVRLAQVVANLLNNAAKYMDPGGRIELTAQREGPEAKITVRDHGAGIPAAMLPRVFEPFIQVGAALDRAQGGLGIGLTLVKRLVEMHGGRVEARSQGIGAGSEFIVHLPLIADAESAPANAQHLSQPQTGATDPAGSKRIPRRILVVDDNEDSAASLGMLLEMLGAEVQVAHNGPDALDALPRFRPEVALVDIGMPGMNGYEVAKRIRARTDFQALTLIALTGWGQEEDRRRTQAAGFDFHLIKPADINALESLLATLDNRSDRPS